MKGKASIKLDVQTGELMINFLCLSYIILKGSWPNEGC